MPWKFQVESIERNENNKRRAEVVVIYYDEIHKEVRRHLVGSKAELVAIVSGTLAEYAAVDDLLAAGTVLDLAPVVLTPPEPTKEQQAAAEWWDRFVVARTQAILATVPDDVRADYRPEYGELR